MRVQGYNEEKAEYQLFKQTIIQEVENMQTLSVEKTKLLQDLESEVETLKEQNEVKKKTIGELQEELKAALKEIALLAADKIVEKKDRYQDVQQAMKKQMVGDLAVLKAARARRSIAIQRRSGAEPGESPDKLVKKPLDAKEAAVSRQREKVNQMKDMLKSIGQ